MKKILSLTLILLFLATFSAMAEGQNEKLPYQELIDKGLLYKEAWNNQGEWEIAEGRVMEVAYHPSLRLDNDRIIAVAGDKKYGRLYDLTERYKVSDYYLSLYKPDTQEFWDREAKIGRAAANGLITINGVNWQESKYKDMILKGTFGRWPMLNDPAYLKYMLDPKYNGMTNKYIYFCDGVDLYLNSDRMDVRYELKETKKKLPIKVFSDGGNSMIPLRGVLEELGAVIDYNSKTKEITINDKGHTVVLKQGSNIAKVDGVVKKMPKPVYTVNGYTVIPLRFVSENLDHWVGFFPEDGNRIAILRAKQGPPTR
ncbi:copper amine oxidase N-terminal domain-containing protein [Thermosediminibacter litoriperuensis]|uniref:Copper amine oxidase-like protein n=1 Tax=Thermosediminibacter litoriperuensis TaxID=291989 RepID=A0A5S5AVU9_9FIRM|nr:copper amine oxidase N-terminal domain-containing protein [Thermosediminibacter litoriperuensis]TYP56848.1 copper amine oxidase-like protein [Thermosediminibacter litoriperuensis]